MRLSLVTTGSLARLDAESKDTNLSQLLLINTEQGQIPEWPECIRRLLAALLSFKRINLIFHENMKSGA